MQFENSFEVPLPPDEAWKVLLDVPRIAPCLPGAELTETVGTDKYKGRAGVKVGPVNLYFAGEAEIVEKDEAARKAKLKGKGNDTKGRGQASATVDFALVPQGTGTRVDVKTDLNMTGMVAQYGRASGLMKEIAGAILGQFADNLRKEIEASKPTPATASPGAPSAGMQAAAADAPATATSAPAAASAPKAPAAAPVSAFAILWIALKSWLAGLFGGKRG
jgi:carbon monoxide dehydrogenase subunit G